MQAAEIDASRTFGQAVRLAAAMVRPLDVVDPSLRQLGALSLTETASLARHPLFRRPLERLALASARLDALPIGSVEIERAAGTPEGRLALLLVREPFDEISTVALLVSAAALHRQVLRRTHKTDRQRLRDVFGPDAHLVATQEAPTLHPGLAVAEAGSVLDEAMNEAVPAAAARQLLVDYGLALLRRLAVDASPSVGALFAARLPASARRPEVEAAVRRIEAAQTRQFIRFIRRRVPAWSAIIG